MRKLRRVLFVLQFACFGIFGYIGVVYYQVVEENKQLLELKNEYDSLVSQMQVYSELKNSYLVVFEEGEDLGNSNVMLQDKIQAMNAEINSLQNKIYDMNQKISDIS